MAVTGLAQAKAEARKPVQVAHVGGRNQNSQGVYQQETGWNRAGDLPGRCCDMRGNHLSLDFTFNKSSCFYIS